MDLAKSKRNNWFSVSEIFEDELKIVRNLPGHILNSYYGTLEVPINLVYAKPKLFGVEPATTSLLDCELLRPYQREAAGLIRQYKSALLAFTMGSGKTLTATAAIAHNNNPLPRALVVGPLMSRGSWCGEKSDPYKFFGINTVPLTGVKNTGPEAFADASWIFCHYDIIDAWFPWISCVFKPQAIIVDEAHVIKNQKSVRSRKLRDLTRLNTVEYRIALSGTPVLNNVMDLWPQLDFVCPDAWGKRWDFGQRYTDVKFTEYGAKYEGQANVDELHARLAHVMIRKDRKELLAQLPAMTRQAVHVDMDDESKTTYDLVFRDVRKYLKSVGKDVLASAPGEKLMALTRLCEIVGLGKTKHTVDLCVNALESHDKVVVFCWHKSTANEIVDALGKQKNMYIDVYGPVSGDMSADKRFRTMDCFAASTAKSVFVATISSAGIALNNLVVASCCIFNDLYWLPAPLLQAEARVHRDGQVRGVNVYYVCANGTVDNQMLDKIMLKSESIELASAGDEASGLASTLVTKEAEGSALDDLVNAIMGDMFLGHGDGEI